YHVLLRLLAPRHSPYALSSLTIIRTRSLSVLGRPTPTAHRPQSVIHTACVWSENYRCRVFSCQRASSASSHQLFGLDCSGDPWPRPRKLSKSALLRSFGAWEGSLRTARCPERPASRSRSRSERPAKGGGEYRARTGDLLVANQALSQLS